MVALQCESQREALGELRAEVQQWQQEAQGQRESREKEVQGLRSELREEQSHLQQHRANLESLHRELESTQRQQRDAEDEVSRPHITQVHQEYTGALPWWTLSINRQCRGVPLHSPYKATERAGPYSGSYSAVCVCVCCHVSRSPVKIQPYAVRTRS